MINKDHQKKTSLPTIPTLDQRLPSIPWNSVAAVPRFQIYPILYIAAVVYTADLEQTSRWETLISRTRGNVPTTLQYVGRGQHGQSITHALTSNFCHIHTYIYILTIYYIVIAVGLAAVYTHIHTSSWCDPVCTVHIYAVTLVQGPDLAQLGNKKIYKKNAVFENRLFAERAYTHISGTNEIGSHNIISARWGRSRRRSAVCARLCGDRASEREREDAALIKESIASRLYRSIFTYIYIYILLGWSRVYNTRANDAKEAIHRSRAYNK